MIGLPRTQSELLAEIDQWRFRAARGTGKARLSLQDLAKASGIPKSSLANYLSGVTAMPADVLDALVLSLGATAEQARWWATAWEEALGASGSTGVRSVVPPAQLPGNRQRPRLLPPDCSRFVGRSKELAVAMEALTSPHPGTLVITGAAGVGKTTLATRVGHSVTERFPDGQLHANLNGSGPEPAEAGGVLGRFLRALGVHQHAMPEDVVGRIHLYRTMLAQRRILVVLDNAADAQQVRDLIPSGADCGCIVTSRTSLAELDGVRLPLEMLSRHDAMNLLSNMVGVSRVEPSPAAASAIIEECGRLPLAVWVAGARLAARPHWPLQQMAQALADERRKLDMLTVGDVAVRASVELSYRNLTTQAQSALRKLATLGTVDFAPWALAALLDSEISHSEKLLDELIEVHLVEAHATGGGKVRYRLHDLVRVYGQERSSAEDHADDRVAATERLLSAALRLIMSGDAQLTADFPAVHHDTPGWSLCATDTEQLLSDPLAWHDAEHRFLVHLADRSLSTRAAIRGVQLAAALSSYFRVRSHFDDWQHLQNKALHAAFAQGDHRHQAMLHRALGKLATILDRYPEAISRYQQALADLPHNDPEFAAAATGLAYVYRLTGQYDDARHWFERAATQATTAGTLAGHIYALNGIGVIALDEGDLERARDQFTACLTLSRSANLRPSEAQALRCLGHVHRSAGDYASAVQCYSQARDISRLTGDRLAAIHATASLGDALARSGQAGLGRRLLAETLWNYRADGNLWGEAHVLNALAEAQLAAERPRQAYARAQAAVRIWRSIGSPSWVATGLGTLARSAHALGDPEATTAAETEAASIRAALATR